MNTSGITYQPVQLLMITAKELLPAFRFVNYEGELCMRGERAIGVTEIEWCEGELASVVTLGTIPVELEEGASILCGENVEAGDFGKATHGFLSHKSYGATNGRAIDVGKHFAKIKLVP